MQGNHTMRCICTISQSENKQALSLDKCQKYIMVLVNWMLFSNMHSCINITIQQIGSLEYYIINTGNLSDCLLHRVSFALGVFPEPFY